jgi:hypothetical protein
MTEQASLFTEADLLGPDVSHDEDALQVNKHDHAVVTASIFSGDVLGVVDVHSFPQRALYDRLISQHGNGLPTRANDSRVFINTNAPFSALVCGVQVSAGTLCRSEQYSWRSTRALARAIPRPCSSARLRTCGSVLSIPTIGRARCSEG